VYEAKYLAKLAEYLLRQGYKKNEIVILTFYDSQKN
jgi:superfamily I DNA and/or RNA helicase